MQFAVGEINQITEDVWDSTLRMGIESNRGAVEPSEMEQPVAARIQITGGWEAEVVLCCPLALVRLAAASMFGVDQEAVTAEDVQDVMCELVDIIGGNIKGSLHGDSHMSLPSLVEGSDIRVAYRRHVLLSQVAFQSQGLPIVVMFLGEDTDPA